MITNFKKVLVADDDPVVGKSFERVLGAKGYAVITAANGEEALRKLGMEEYDLLYTDIKMPGMSGLEVAERVKANQPWLPVVIITGYGTEESEARAEAVGVSAFLNKPLSPEMIIGATEMALAGAAAAEAAYPITRATEVPAAAPEAEVPAEYKGSRAKNVLLFLAAPFVGLAYLLVFPFVGLGMLAMLAGKAVMKNDRIRPFAMAIAAPAITLAFVIVGPIVGLCALAWFGGKAILKR